MYRNTCVKVYLDHIKRNVETMIQTFPDYEGYVRRPDSGLPGVCHGHGMKARHV